MSREAAEHDDPTAAHTYIFEGLSLADLTAGMVAAHSANAEGSAAPGRHFLTIEPETLIINDGTFGQPSAQSWFPTVAVTQAAGNLRLSCLCAVSGSHLCEHQVLVLLALLHRPELRVFFDEQMRRQQLVAAARPYGLESERNLEAHFSLRYVGQRLEVMPRRAGLFPLTVSAQRQLAEALLPPRREFPPRAGADVLPTQRMIVVGKHKFYDHLTVHLFEAALTAGGKPKNPLTWVPPLEAGLDGDDLAVVRFYTGISQLQHQHSERNPVADQQALRALVRNPLALPVYASDAPVSEKTTAQTLRPLTLHLAPADVRIMVEEEAPFFAVSASVLLNGKPHDLRLLPLKYGTFVALQPDAWYLPDRPEVTRLLAFFKARHNALLLHKSQFPAFQENILSKLEHWVEIVYTDLAPATPVQLAEHGFAQAPERLIYLADSGGFIDVLPVMKYGSVEVPILSRKTIYATDPATGKPFSVPRDRAAELAFTVLLVRQQPAFEEQLELGREALYLSRRQFLEEEWFLEAFEVWEKEKIAVLGFNELKNNRLNPNKAKVTVRVGTEVNWFDTELHVHFGGQRAPLASIHKALRNKNKYVTLGDGTHGILPEDWIAKFARYFAAGELVGDRIRTPKINYAAIRDEYEDAALAPETRAQLAEYEAQVADFAGIAPLSPPPGLRGQLRPYQQHGLNWLGFLDTFNFGGCLADDMGLGKTITVLAFLLTQKAKIPGAVSLVVVPTSLVFNWRAEAAKFAPSLRLLTAHGPDRPRSSDVFAGYDVVLTTYGTLLTDIVFLKNYRFNYVFLDESQAIKNPDSLRYRAARLLQARNRVVLTGTPLENNTYDLYGQLSFACPGLLGSQQHFKDLFAVPIDKFNSDVHARALRRKIEPFVLRRTKQQVAAELPPKTEMVLRCEMDEEQRRVYDFYRKEYRDRLMGQHPDHPLKERANILQGLTKLRQICDSPALLPDAEGFGAASVKLQVLLREIDNKAPQHKILVFSQFVRMLDIIRAALAERGIPTAYLTGQTRDRAGAVAAFQNDPKVRVFLISLKAGGTGLNLTEADYVYLVDPWWNPAVENQAIDRSHRLGQDKPVVAVRLICPDTIEEKIQTMQAGKTALASDLIRTDAAVLKSLSRAELLDLFS
ncbi:DEAD/DEAH box helicase [Hymenobacter negativus]|uniref:SNF2 helicase associated domain-containing protein n=1 Tax=Hymenobacter negativus TaxID=2795026 RepID=A0ABS3QLB0_9BACT|nr:DEAD/DEAH box helicase [Hymenobacter negativus]MBO2012017.1 SNF2 helicase associated domain-containing protein [Hymenobacter negativus]